MKGMAMYGAKSKFMHFSKLDVLAIGVVCVIFAPLIWWIADRKPPVEFLRYDIFPTHVKAGETVFRIIRVNRLRLCETDPDTIIIDGGKIRWNFDEPALLAPGKIGVDEYKRPVRIPEQAMAGQSEMRTSATYVCNPVHRIWPIKVVGEPLKFEIVK